MPHRPRILLTGFGPFPGVPHNPSETVVRAIAGLAETEDRGYDLATRILPTQFGLAVERLIEALEAERPTAVLAIGVGRAGAIRLERRARNADRPGVPDAAGLVRDGTAIVEGGPATYRSSLDLQAIRSALVAADIPVRYSQDAGGYVCNHVFYHLMHVRAAVPDAGPCGFVHLPPTVGPTAPNELDQRTRATLMMLDAVRDQCVACSNARVSRAAVGMA